MKNEGASAPAQYFVAIDGKPYGPYSYREIVQYVEENKILPKDLVWREGLKEWISVGSLLEEIGLSQQQESDLPTFKLNRDAITGRKPRSRLGKLTAETIRLCTKNGDLPLHRGAKNKTFDEIPRELLTTELFLIQNRDGETALHVAARNCSLSQIPEEFLTMETLSVMEHYGRNPVHLAAQYGCLNQLPGHLLTPEVLGARTNNSHRESAVHLAARHDQLGNIPNELLTQELLNQKNAEGQTPVDCSQPTKRQMAYFEYLGVRANKTTLTIESASQLIDTALDDKQRREADGSGPMRQADLIIQQSQSCCFTIVELTQGTREWIEWRHKGIGASDAPTIMGENPWKTVAELLAEKRQVPRDSIRTEAMLRGIELEPEARCRYIRSTGNKVRPACVQSNHYAWLRASVDGITPEGDWVVEIKCGNSVYRQVSESGCPPNYYYGQFQHILAVTGLGSIDFWCYLPGQPELLMRVERNDAYINRLLETESRFWKDVVRD